MKINLEDSPDQINEKMKTFFDEVASAYSKHDNLFIGDYLKSLQWQILKKYLRKEDQILDLCCGVGLYLIPLHQDGCQITGLDFSPPMLEQLKAKDPSVKLILSDAKHTNLSNETFNLIFCFGNSIGNIAGEENRLQVFRESCRLLKKGGVFLVSACHRYYGLRAVLYWLKEALLNPQGLGDVITPYFNHCFGYLELKNQLLKAGFKKIMAEQGLFSPYLIFAAIK